MTYNRIKQQPTTEEQAIESLNRYTEIYHSLAVCQYKLSRQTKSIEASLVDAHKEINRICTKVIERSNKEYV